MSGYAVLTTVNKTNHPCWITIYDLAEVQHLDWGDLGPNSSRDWASGNYLYGSYYHIRYEVKGPDGKNLFDTRMRIGPDYYNNNAYRTMVRLLETPTGFALAYVNGG